MWDKVVKVIFIDGYHFLTTYQYQNINVSKFLDILPLIQIKFPIRHNTVSNPFKYPLYPIHLDIKKGVFNLLTPLPFVFLTPFVTLQYPFVFLLYTSIDCTFELGPITLPVLRFPLVSFRLHSYYTR